MKIRRARVRVADRDGEELEEAARSTGASRGDDCRHDLADSASERPIFRDNQGGSRVAAARVSGPMFRIGFHAD